MKKRSLSVILLFLFLFAFMSVPALSAPQELNYTGPFYTPLTVDGASPNDNVDGYGIGVTTVLDPASPTGCMAHFVYKNETAVRVEITCSFTFVKVGAHLTYYTPWEWEPGMYPIGNSGRGMADTDGMIFFDENGNIQMLDRQDAQDMVKSDNGLWYTCIPVVSGSHSFRFRSTSEDGSTSQSSAINAYGIFDPDKQVLNRSAWLPPAVTGAPAGTSANYTFDDIYTDHPELKDLVLSSNFRYATGDQKIQDQPELTVWLPAGYDKDRAEPYKVIYLASGGNGGNSVGTGYTNIMNNLIAEGVIEPFILVGINTGNYNSRARMTDEVGWIGQTNLVEYIIPYMEANFNVSTEVSGRAVGGQSHGGKWTTRMHYAYPKEFGYYVVMFCGDETVAYLCEDGQIPDGFTDARVWAGSGYADHGTSWIFDSRKLFGSTLYYEESRVDEADGSSLTYWYRSLTQLGLYEEDHNMVYGEHGGNSGPECWETVLREFLWKDKADGPAAPAAVTGSYTDNGKTFTYTVDSIPNAQYRIDTENWQDSNVFTGIKPSSTHEFFARIKETDTNYASKMTGTGSVRFEKLINVVDLADVEADDAFYDDAMFAYTRGLLSGTDSNGLWMFSPHSPLTRGMAVDALYRMVGNPDPFIWYNPFNDVSGTPYANAARWAVRFNIEGGYGSGNGNRWFAPDDNITREDLALIIARFADASDEITLTPMRGSPSFADNANIADYAKDAVELVYRAGIMDGKAGNEFDPKGTITRAEASGILRELMNNAVPTGFVWTDLGEIVGRYVPSTKLASISISGDASAYAEEGATAKYTISAGNLEQVGLVVLTIEVDGTYFSGNSEDASGAFDLFNVGPWISAGDGKWQRTYRLMYENGFTGYADLLDVILNVLGECGDTTVKIVGLALYSDDKPVDFIITNDTVTTTISDRPIVYSIYDLNKDGFINDIDLSMAITRYRKGIADDDWNYAKIADVNDDGVVTLADLTLIFANFTLV